MNKKLLILLLLAAISCSKKEQKGSAELSYVEAHKLLQKKDYAEAANEFEKIDDEYPFSKWAAKGQAMAVYARYKNEDYAKLVATVDDFIRLNPSSSLVPYMLYMKGLTYYNQIPDIRRAQDNTQQASYIFREIIARFPETSYSLDAKDKLSFIDEHLSGAKMSVGRSQIESGNYVGAILTFSEVISRYRYTTQVDEARLRLEEVDARVGLRKGFRRDKSDN